jgi:hypothetical protein
MRSYGSSRVLGLAMTLVTTPDERLRQLLIATCIVKAIGEASLFLHLGDRRHNPLKRSALLSAHDLRAWTLARFAALASGVGLVALDGPPALALAFLVIGELLERTLFFAASSSPGMPGGVR